MDFLPEVMMDTFAPEFSKFWLPEASGSRADSRADDESAQQAALEELAERVNAARSVV
jgi:hypothetical protein